MAASAKVIKLRQLLHEKFPAAHAQTPQERPTFFTGVPMLDQVGIPKGALTEVVGQLPSQGGSLLINALLQAAHQHGYHVAVVDGQDSFDPQSAGATACQRMLWIRCHNATEALKAADLILRDGNLPVGIIDLRLNSETELRKVNKQTWYRLQTLVQRTQGMALVLTPSPMVSSAAVRFDLGNTFQLKDLESSQQQLLHQFVLPVTRKRTGLRSFNQPTPRPAQEATA